jgi:uncharacterized protein
MNQAQSDLVRDLSRPEAYGQGASVPVLVRTTHASWVFLIGDDVWKVKRPVDFGFLDFRTVEARRRFCEYEVHLNRRLAPGIYLGVEPVRSSEQGHKIGGAGPIVDWAVHMRRLPDAAAADVLLARGALDAGMLGGLAERLASFYAGARLAPELGTPAVLAANVAENFAQVRPFVGDLVDRKVFNEVEEFQTVFLRAEHELFEARVEAGRIREGHGDIRLEHVYFLDGEGGHPSPAVIDCIEFADRFRCGDVAGDVAFLAMELEAARRPDLAAGFLARFAEATDDFSLYRLLDFYLSYRAWVRGKVAGFVAADPSVEPALRRHKREEAARNFALARACLGPPVDAPYVIVVGGLVGSGKSTLAEALGRQLAAPVVSSDRTRKSLAGLAPTTRGDATLYTPENVERVYGELLGRASDVIAGARGVILDATFSARRWRKAAAALAESAGAVFVFVEATCPDRQQLRARLAARRSAPSVSDATDDVLDDIERRYDPARPEEVAARIQIDTRPAPDVALTALTAHLRDRDIVPAIERKAS